MIAHALDFLDICHPKFMTHIVSHTPACLTDQQVHQLMWRVLQTYLVKSVVRRGQEIGGLSSQREVVTNPNVLMIKYMQDMYVELFVGPYGVCSGWTA